MSMKEGRLCLARVFLTWLNQLYPKAYPHFKQRERVILNESTRLFCQGSFKKYQKNFHSKRLVFVCFSLAEDLFSTSHSRSLHLGLRIWSSSKNKHHILFQF